MKVIVLFISSSLLMAYPYVEGSVLSVVKQNGDEAIDGSSVEIVCITDGSAPVYNWYALQESSASITDIPLSVCLIGNKCAPETLGRYNFSVTGNDASVQISELKIVDEKYWICNNDQNDSNYKQLFLEVKVPITMVSMGYDNITVMVNTELSLVCTTSYGKPKADITFFKENGSTIMELQASNTNYNQSGNHLTIGELTFTTTIADNSSGIYCRANNTFSQIPISSTIAVLLIKPAVLSTGGSVGAEENGLKVWEVIIIVLSCVCAVVLTITIVIYIKRKYC